MIWSHAVSNEVSFFGELCYFPTMTWFSAAPVQYKRTGEHTQALQAECWGSLIA